MSPGTVDTTCIVELQLMSVAEIITDIRTREELEIRCVFLVLHAGVGI